MKIRLLLSLLFSILVIGFIHGQETETTPEEKTKKERPSQSEKGERPKRGEGRRPGGERGEMTPERWRAMSERMPKIGKISGKIIDKDSGKPIEYATVALLLSMDSSIVSGGVTNEKGIFEMEELPMGRFIVSVEFMGYDTYYSSMVGISPRKQTEHNLGNIELYVKSESLSEVVVKEKKPFMELELDKKVYNVGDNITVTGGTATEVLEQIPSIDIDIDGNVSLRGSQNMRILIDGRPTALAGGDPAAVLEQIPSETIEKVEVITAPSAKYDPEGMTGILNIILKKNKKIGLTGLVSVNWGVIDYDEYGANASIGYKNKKMNISASYSLRDRERESYRENYRLNTFPDTTFSFRQDGENARGNISHNAKLGFEFYPNSNSTIYSSASFGIRDGDGFSENIYQNFDSSDEFVDVQRILNSNIDERFNKDFNLGYQNRIKGDWNHVLNIDLSYSDNSDDETDNINQASFGSNDIDFTDPIGDIYTQTDRTDGFRSVLRAGVDYEKPFKNEAKLEVGYSGIIRDSRSNFDSSNDLFDNEFLFDERIHSVYTTYAHPITETFTVKGGIRLEQAITDGELIDTNDKFDKNYFSWFPSFSLSKKLSNDGGEMSLSYSRRISRPRSRQINPFVNYSDPLNLRRGNPDLNPEYTNAMELNYMKRWDKLTITPAIFYRYSTGNINRYREVDNDGVYTLTYINFSNSHAYGAELVAVYSPFKWWRIMPSLNMSQTISTGSTEEEDINVNALRLGGRISSNMSFENNWDVQFFIFYRSPANISQGRMKRMLFANIGVKKKILNEKGTIGLNIRDPFATGKFQFTTSGDTFFQEGFRQREPYVFNLSFSYRFGKQERNRRGRGGNRDNGGGDGGFDDMID